ncbi:MAG: high-potential iron-sulfur protein [Pseudohongiellaceae bacterium]
MDKRISRRTILKRGLQIPLGGSVLFGLAACGNDGGSSSAMVCADLNMMTSAEESIRRTLKYTEISQHGSSKVCASCAFFNAPAQEGGCGSCEIFAGKPVNPGGYCDSWSVDA